MTTHSPTTPSLSPSTAPSPWHPVWEIVRFELQESLRNRFPLIAFGLFFIVGLLIIHGLASDLLFFPAIRTAMGMTPRPGDSYLAPSDLNLVPLLLQ